MRVALDLRNASLDLWIARANSGKLRVYSGTRPTNANTALSGNTLLGEFTMNATSFARTDGTLTAGAIAAITAAAAGTASFARLVEDDGTTPIADFGVTTSAPANGTELQLPTLTVASGQGMSVTSLVITWPVGS